MIKNIEIGIPIRKYRNLIVLYIFIYYQILKYGFNKFFYLIIFIINIIIIKLNIFFGIFFITLSILIIGVLALEETSHIAMLIILGKREIIKNFCINRVERMGIAFLGGAAIHYKGNLKESELLCISIAGPLIPIELILIFSVINLFLSFLVLDSYYLLYFIFLIIFPFISLIPIKKGIYASDGFWILTISRNKKLDLYKIIELFLYITKEISKLFFAKKIERKDNINV